MRKFRLITGIGKEIDLTDVTVGKIFFHDPQGLGYETEMATRRIGSKIDILAKRKNYPNISGQIAFLGSEPYKQYAQFCSDISYGNNILVYQTNAIDVYKREVIISTLDKTEILKEGGYLDVGVEFTPLAPWYKELTLVTNPATDVDTKGLIWDVHSRWPIGFRSTREMTIVINVDSNEDSPCSFIIDGRIQNPMWSHYVNGALQATGKLNYTVPANHHLAISNLNTIKSILVYNSDYSNVVADVYQSSDFSTKRFITLKKGANTIHVSSDNDANVKLSLEAKIYYATV